MASPSWSRASAAVAAWAAMDEGHGPDDNPAGDDLSIRMPLPELKQK
jgi:hypothetical protein